MTRIIRHILHLHLHVVLGMAIFGSLPAFAQPLQSFGFQDVAERAQKLAQAAYQKPARSVPKALEQLSYDQYRDIRFKPEKSLWRGQKLPFEVAFFHQGLFFGSPVKIHEVIGGVAREVVFDPSLFDYGANKLDPKDLEGLGYAGFRVHYPINTPKYKDEILVFLGASYFRALGKGQRYGLSARGLALDTALNSGEEFPQFTAFWIEQPKQDDKSLTIYALLDSRRLAGAYQFTVRPGVDTVVDVKSRLFLRENVTKIGLAPLTSMFLFGENQRSPTEDYRPEVHDSDGLSLHSGTGEWIWRPLVNPKRLTVTSFATTNPGGFGLMQRDRTFNQYEDLEAHYELRPSAWVEPHGSWGSGRVELVQIPTPDETNDNIVAFWVPDVPPKPGQPFDVDYRLSWQKQNEKRPPLSWVTQTRRGHGYVRKPDDSLSFTVDFDGPIFGKLPIDAKIQPVVSVDGNGRLVETNAFKNAMTGGVRMTIRVRRIDENKPVEMRAYLRSEQTTLSETWSYILTPN